MDVNLLKRKSSKTFKSYVYKSYARYSNEKKIPQEEKKLDSCLKIYFNFFRKKFKRYMLKIKFSPLHSKYVCYKNESFWN